MIYPEPGPTSPTSDSSSNVPAIPLRPRIWGGWATVGLGLVIIIIYSLVQSGVGIFFVVARLTQDPQLDLFDAVSGLISDGLFISIATILSAAVGTGLVVLFVLARRGARLKEYLNLRALSRRSIVQIAVALAGLLAISVVVGLFWSQSNDTGFTLDALKSSPSPVLFALAVLIFAPLFEEFFFRGFLFKGLQFSGVGAAGAVIVTALLWSALHLQYDVAGIVEIFILGLVFGIVRLKTDSLYSTLSLHFLWNLAALISAALALRT